jgi:hypothetical protein
MILCNLCQSKEATQKNSHIFPKFMGTSMLISQKGPPKGFKITTDRGIYYKPFQDTPKEDHLFCPDCESHIANKYEGPFARNFYETRNNSRGYFNVHYKKAYSYRVYYHIDHQLFIKLFYSILFRAGIASIDYFKDFNLPYEIMKKLRNILLDDTPFESLPLIITTCPNNPYPSGNLIGALSSDSNVYLLAVNEYLVFLDLSGKNVFETLFPDFLAPNYELVRIITIPYSGWESLIRGPIVGPILDRMYKRLWIKYIIDGLFYNKLIAQENQL